MRLPQLLQFLVYDALLLYLCATLQNLPLLLLQQMLLFYMNLLLLPVFYGNAIPAVKHGSHIVVANVVVVVGSLLLLNMVPVCLPTTLRHKQNDRSQ